MLNPSRCHEVRHALIFTRAAVFPNTCIAILVDAIILHPQFLLFTIAPNMSFPIIVDIAIGLVFIYLLLSLLASEIQELIATLLQWRAKHLKDSITNLFSGDAHSKHSVDKAHQLAKQVYQHPLIRSINQESRGFLSNMFRGITWSISRLYREIIRKSEGEFGDRRTAPSYIPREAFATALLEQLGAKHFVERLVEAKFSDFVFSSLTRVSNIEGENKQDAYERLERSLHSIEKEFILNNIDLNSALQSIILKLDTFLDDMERGQHKNEDLEELRDWRNRVFLDNELERTIKSIGLKPTLQEIVDSIDKNSKIFRTYQKRFQRYEQERFNDVRHDLRDLNKFLLVFLNGILGEEAIGESETSQAIDKPTHKLNGFHHLDNLFFRLELSADTKEGPIQRTKIPISQLELIILDKLNQLENNLNPKIENGKTLNLRRRIHAFREGFAGRDYLSELRYYFIFREFISSKILPFCLLFILGFLLAVVLSDIALDEQLTELNRWQQYILAFRNLLIGRRGGIVALLFLALIPFTWFTVSNWHFDSRRRQCHRELADYAAVDMHDSVRKRLPEIFDDYLAEEISASLEESSQEPIRSEELSPHPEEPHSTLNTMNRSRENSDISHAIQARLNYIAKESDAALFSEIKDLGRSFRRYYLRFTLENADVDLPFIPNSVKQSLAVLIRRSKTSAKQAEDQIMHLKTEVEAWYERSMDRASGVYRRNAKGVAIAIGIFLAIAVNANSIHILDQLAFEEELRLTLRETVQQTFENRTAAGSNDVDQMLDEFRQEISPALDEINLPIGWDPYLINEEFECNLQTQMTDDADVRAEENDTDRDLWNRLIQSCIFNNEEFGSESSDISAPPDTFFYPTAIASIFLKQPLIGLRYLLGWIITGIAISMGASFWFDLLGKLVKVRNTGKPIPALPETETNINTKAEE